ncbi:MAG: hypothetical protein NC120_01025 [Ruminococcus sp.]|nr:hypothetical protein [Ruminococcus sp.]
MNGSSHTSYKVAIGGVVSALCLALMFMTGVFPLLSLAIPIYAGALMIVISKEVSASWAFAAYCAVSLLSLFLTPDKEAAALFIMFFGYYPIILPKLGKIKGGAVRLAAKFAVFNVSMVMWYKLMTFIMGVYDFFGDFSFLGKYAVIGVFIFINLVFLLYDYTIRMIETIYVNWFRPTYLGKKKRR